MWLVSDAGGYVTGQTIVVDGGETIRERHVSDSLDYAVVDVFIAMPPEPFGYEGRELVARYCGRQFAAGRRFDLVPVRANGQPAFGSYLRGPAGIRHAAAFYVLTLAGGQICGMTRFEASVLPWFGLPRSLPGR